jgi:hypothetical protein
MKRILPGFVTAIVLISLLGLIINQVITKAVNKLIMERLSTLLFTRFDFLDLFFHPSQLQLKGLGFADTVLRANLVRNTITASAGSIHGSISLHIIFFVVLVIPLLALSAGGFLSSKLSSASSRRDVIHIGAGIGILYALFLAVMSLYGTVISTILIPLTREGLKLTSTFSLIDALCHGFLLGFLFSSFGAWLHVRRNH